MTWVYPIVQLVVTAICSVLASAGFWSYLTKRRSNNDNETKILIGLAHNRIISLGEFYLERGYISTDEYENLYDYLYTPYHNLGGNGAAKKIIEEVKKLPIGKKGDNNENQ